MSPSGPYQGDPGQDPYRRPPQQYQQPPQYGEPQYGDRYQDPRGQHPYGQDQGAPYGRDQYQQPPQQQPYRPSPQEMYPDEGGGFRFRLPGIGLLLSLVGIAVQLLCMLVLPWVSAAAAGG